LDYNDDKDTIFKRNKILRSHTGSTSIARNSILLYPSALGIEIICILSSITGESLGFYLFGFNIVGIIYAYSLGFIVAGFTIFLVILGRYREHQNFNLCCHDNNQFLLGFKSNFITTFKHFKNGWYSLSLLFYNENRNKLLKRALYLLLTAESICVITAQTVDLLFYNYSVFLSIPLALIVGSLVISIQQAEEMKKNKILVVNKYTNKNNKPIKSNFKVVPTVLSVNAILVILFVISGGYNHYDITSNSKYHTHIMNSQNETYFSAPAEVVVETDEQGTGINLDYLSIVKPDSNPLNQIFKIPSSRHIINTNFNNINHPEGNIRFSNNQSFYLDFYECHNLGCKPPEEIIDVYMTSNSISDKRILENSLNDKEKIVFVNSSELSFHPTMPNVNDVNDNSNNLFNKLVIHTQQRENIEAFYIYNVNLTRI
jgi:hypothetical protein